VVRGLILVFIFPHYNYYCYIGALFLNRLWWSTQSWRCWRYISPYLIIFVATILLLNGASLSVIFITRSTACTRLNATLNRFEAADRTPRPIRMLNNFLFSLLSFSRCQTEWCRLFIWFSVRIFLRSSRQTAEPRHVSKHVTLIHCDWWTRITLVYGRWPVTWFAVPSSFVSSNRTTKMFSSDYGAAAPALCHTDKSMARKINSHNAAAFTPHWCFLVLIIYVLWTVSTHAVLFLFLWKA
jgi:hypothetical protein